MFDGVTYPAVNVWPMPTTVDLPTAPLGPHAVPPPATTGGGGLQVDVAASCGPAVVALAAEAVTLATRFRGPLRSYNASAYTVADGAACAPSQRCLVDADCDGGAGGGPSSCYVRSDLRWSSSSPCSPTSTMGLTAKCGCCVRPSARPRSQRGTTSTPNLPAITTLSVQCTAADRLNDGDDNDESHDINITAAAISVTAATPVGAARALATLAQLLRWDTDLQTLVADVVPLHVHDAPLYEYRGLMIDVARHFVPLEGLLRLVDAMSSAKLNKLHVHATDSTAWPVASEAYPELAREGSWGGAPATVYAAADMAALVARGRARFVEVIFELDTPAHSLSVARSHPEMMADCWEWMADSGFKVDVDSDDTAALDPTSEAARKMVRTVLQEVAGIQGAGPGFVHIGGDEVKYPCWDADPQIRQHVIRTYGNASDAAYSLLQAEWTANVSAAAVVDAGKVPVLWQPTTKGFGDPAWDDALPEDAVYMVWLNAASAASYAYHGRRVVYTTPYYVAGMGSNGYLNVYNAELMPQNLTPAQQKNILGGQVCAWGESMGGAGLGLDFRALTIGAGAAESFWRVHEPGRGVASGAGLALGDRFNRFLCHVRRFGVGAAPIMPSHCEVVHGKP